MTQCDGSDSSPERYNRFVLGTVCQITLYQKDSQSAAERAFDELARIESVFSRNIETSDISRFGTESAENGEISFRYIFQDETAEVLEKALAYASDTGGRYNPAIGPLVDLWGIGTDNARVPAREEIEAVLPLIDWADLSLTGNELTARGGMEIDLGGIAKGYAADRVKAILEEEGMTRGIINLGGNVLVMGKKADGSLWKIGVQNPLSERGDYIGILSLESLSMVTSGNYERYFVSDGVRYHHILDSDTGYPVENNLASVTIVTPLSLDADALSTSLYAMGLEEGMAYAESKDYFEALFVTGDNKVYVSSGLADDFRLTGEGFTLSSL